jgi:pyridinium-3,5-bisthiocarboxylic acid mononucleotide nickel chelatase
LRSLDLPGFRLETRRVTKEHLTGVKVDFLVDMPQPARRYADIAALISRADLSEGVKDLSLRMFRLLAEVEARIHGMPVDDVHFHELGGADTILDVVGAAFGVEALGITRTLVSPIPQGWGMIAAGGHGSLPNPAPATLELLEGLDGVRHRPAGRAGDAHRRGDPQSPRGRKRALPPLTSGTGGLWGRQPQPPRPPESLAPFSGRTPGPGRGRQRTGPGPRNPHRRHEPELYEPLMAKLFAAGALDVALAPIQMKKNRPGVRLTVVAPPPPGRGCSSACSWTPPPWG